MRRLINRWKYKDLVRGYPPLIFPHLGDPLSLTLDEQDANLAYLLQVAPDRIAAIRGLTCELGTPVPEVFSAWHLDRAFERLMEVFSSAMPKSVWKHLRDTESFHSTYVHYDIYYQPLAGPFTLWAACADLCLLIGQQLIAEGTCSQWQVYQRDGKGRLMTRWSTFGVPILVHPNEKIAVDKYKYGDNFITPSANCVNLRLGMHDIVLEGSRSLINGSGSASHVETLRANYWGRQRERDPNAGYDALGRDMVQYNTYNAAKAPQGLPFPPPTQLRALTPEETALHDQAWADYPAFWARYAPKTTPAKYAAGPKPFRFPKVWAEKGKYTHDLSAYTPPDLGGHSLWWDESKSKALNRQILAIMPERCALITDLLRQNGITAAPTAEAWDQIGDWLTRIIEPNREGTRPDEDILLDDPVQYGLFRPLHYALLSDLAMLMLQHFADMPGAETVPLWHVQRSGWIDSEQLTVFIPVQRRVMDSHPPRTITDGYTASFLVVFYFAVPAALRAMGSEFVEDWIEENNMYRFLGDPFRYLEEMGTTPWDEENDPKPAVLYKE